MELSAIVAILRRWSVTLIASGVLAGLVALFVASQVPPTYAAEVEVLVGPINTDENTLGASRELVQTYGQLVTTDRVLDVVIESLGLDVTPAELRETISARAESVTRILVIEALAGDPESAERIAAEVVAALNAVTSEGQVRPEGAIGVVTAARANPDPVEPQVSIIVVLAIAAGLVAALTVVLLIDYFSNSVAGGDDLAQLSDAPFLGSINPGRGHANRDRQPLVVEAAPDSAPSIAYRVAASRISAHDPSLTLRSVVILGADGREEAGTVAANIAGVLAQRGLRVRLIDANEDDREITQFLGLEGRHQLGELGRGQAKLLNRMVHRVAPGMDVVAHLPGRDPRLKEEDRVAAVLELLLEDSDMVVINTAPIHRSASALLWARSADGAVLVARRDRTNRDSVSVSAETLRLIGTPLVGTILHGSSRGSAWRFGSRTRAGGRASAVPASEEQPAASGRDSA